MASIDPLSDSESDSEAEAEFDHTAMATLITYARADSAAALTAYVMGTPYAALVASVAARAHNCVVAILALPGIDIAHNNCATFKEVIDSGDAFLAVQFCRHSSCRNLNLAPLIERATNRGLIHMADLLRAFQ